MTETVTSKSSNRISMRYTLVVLAFGFVLGAVLDGLIWGLVKWLVIGVVAVGALAFAIGFSRRPRSTRSRT